MRGQLPAQDPA